MPNRNTKNDKSGNSVNKRKPKNLREQPRKDSPSKRVNYDNARLDKVEKDIAEGMTKEGRNDPSFWNKYPELLKSAGSLPFASILGRPIENSGAYVPGVFVYSYGPTIGADNSLALNKMFREMYSFMVHANSRNYSYNASDLGIVVLAGIEVFAAIEELKRVYGIMKFYAEQNAYAPSSIVAGLGFNPYSVRNNLGQAWFQINDLINQSKQIWIPKGLNILKRRIQMATSVYTDAPGFRSQYYIFRRKIFWKYSEISSTTGGCLVPVEMTRTPSSDSTLTSVYTTFSEAVSVVQKMINSLLYAEDRGIMYGDILKAYGAENIFAEDMITSDYITVPEYNAEIMMQIENLRVCSFYQGFVFQTPTTPSSAVDTAIIGTWVQKNYVTATNQYATPDLLSASDITSATGEFFRADWPSEQAILNLHIPTQPTPEQIAVATRLTCGGLKYGPQWTFTYDSVTGLTPSMTTTNYLAPGTIGTEVVVSACYITQPTKENAVATLKNFYVEDYVQDFGTPNSGETTTIAVDRELLHVMAFDWHPFYYELATNSPTTTSQARGYAFRIGNAFGDYDNYIIMSAEELNKLNDVCLFSVFAPV